MSPTILYIDRCGRYRPDNTLSTLLLFIFDITIQYSLLFFMIVGASHKRKITIKIINESDCTTATLTIVI